MNKYRQRIPLHKGGYYRAKFLSDNKRANTVRPYGFNKNNV